MLNEAMDLWNSEPQTLLILGLYLNSQSCRSLKLIDSLN